MGPIVLKDRPEPDSTLGPVDLRALVLLTLSSARLLAISPTQAQTGQPVPARESITGRLAELQNPVLLFIHGGLGTPEMPDRWFWQRPWEVLRSGHRRMHHRGAFTGALAGTTVRVIADG